MLLIINYLLLIIINDSVLETVVNTVKRYHVNEILNGFSRVDIARKNVKKIRKSVLTVRTMAVK